LVHSELKLQEQICRCIALLGFETRRSTLTFFDRYSSLENCFILVYDTLLIREIILNVQSKIVHRQGVFMNKTVLKGTTPFVSRKQ
jgi:hypothetical protein